ncbi:MAG TPA: disulfide bond formation protein B [Candidatus Paceibacterota bacterium]|nr:disulfide bond formation protein B [Candidatus Paceibacterota bacterium]
MSLLFTLNFVLAVGGLAMLVLTIGLFVDYIFYQRQFYLQYVSPVAWPLILLVTIGSVLLSLLYSEYFGFVPCSLCWLQRIALYPQALFALMAFKTRENIFYPMYSIGLSVFGLIVAVYH